ncbi:MAG: serine protease Do [Phenylobacterium sp.]|jgi:serine protease Do
MFSQDCPKVPNVLSIINFISRIALATVLSLAVGFNTLAQTNEAEQLFNTLKPALYQIRLIEQATGNKSSIGSGFQIDDSGVIATNYHVISDYVQYEDKFRLEYLDHQGNKAPLEVLDVDVINDLALVKRTDAATAFFALAGQSPAQGEKIFSLGNPHDLGMIVVPGTYNGLKDKSFYDRIHFTGSVNPGMSGGPTVNLNGEVVGINVATAGNQIGFLVPLDKLSQLYQRYQSRGDAVANLKQLIGEQLHANQQRLFDLVLNADWHVKTLGTAKVPGEIASFIRCWGRSNADKKDAKYLSAVSNCIMDEQVYLSQNFRSGNIGMQYEWLKTDELNRYRFYNMYQESVANMGADTRAGKNDVTEYECNHNLVATNNGNTNSKAVICSRAYKEYPGLFDVAFIAASYDKEQQGLISHFTLSGVEKALALKFTEKFMESATWN